MNERELITIGAVISLLTGAKCALGSPTMNGSNYDMCARCIKEAQKLLTQLQSPPVRSPDTPPKKVDRVEDQCRVES